MIEQLHNDNNACICAYSLYSCIEQTLLILVVGEALTETSTNELVSALKELLTQVSY